MNDFKFNVGDTVRVRRGDGEPDLEGVVLEGREIGFTGGHVYRVESVTKLYVNTSWYSEESIAYAPDPWQWVPLVQPAEKSWLFEIGDTVRVRHPTTHEYRGLGIVRERHVTPHGDDVYQVFIDGDNGWHKVINLAPSNKEIASWVESFGTLPQPGDHIKVTSQSDPNDDGVFEVSKVEVNTLSAMLDAAGTPEVDEKYPVRWVTGDKRAMRIEDMKDDHLLKTLYYLRRKAKARFKRLMQEHKILGNDAALQKMKDIQESVAMSSFLEGLADWFRGKDPHYAFIEDEAAERGLNVHPTVGWNAKKEQHPLDVEEMLDVAEVPPEAPLKSIAALLQQMTPDLEIIDEVHLTPKKGKKKKQLSERAKLQAKQKKQRADDDAEVQPAHNPSRRKFKL